MPVFREECVVLVNPKLGSKVQVWYRAGLREIMPHHGKIGTVSVVCRGRPRNHGVLLDGVIVSVPCGNLRRPA
jgi:hypothetical protein